MEIKILGPILCIQGNSWTETHSLTPFDALCGVWSSYQAYRHFQDSPSHLTTLFFNSTSLILFTFFLFSISFIFSFCFFLLVSSQILFFSKVSAASFSSPPHLFLPIFSIFSLHLLIPLCLYSLFSLLFVTNWMRSRIYTLPWLHCVCHIFMKPLLIPASLDFPNTPSSWSLICPCLPPSSNLSTYLLSCIPVEAPCAKE